MRALNMFSMLSIGLMLAACSIEDSSYLPPKLGPGHVLAIGTGDTLPFAHENAVYSATITAFGGSGSGYTWAIVAGTPPPGLTLNASGTPDTTLSGTPTVPGTYSFYIEVTDSDGAKSNKGVSLLVKPAPAPPPPLTIVTGSLPVGQQGSFYTANVLALGGAQSGYTWSVVSGAMPAGFTLTGGTPAAAIFGTDGGYGQYTFTLQVEDSFGGLAAMAFTLDILPIGAPAPTSTCYGHSVSGRILFVVDATLYAYGSPVAAIRQELSACVNALSATDEFDIVVYSFSYGAPNYYSSLWGTFNSATGANKSQALAYIASPAMLTNGMGAHAQYPAVRDAYANYANVAHMFFVATHGDYSLAQVLTDIAAWHATDPNRQVHVVSYANSSATNYDLQAMAGITGGTYFHP